jgi:glycosyltransferase involved in cell wall biosynthesis
MGSFRILHFSTSDLHGGAAKAAYRLHGALRQAGHKSSMIVRDKFSDDPDVLTVEKRNNVVLFRKALARFLPGFAWLKQTDFNFDLNPAIRLEPLLDEIKEPVNIICLHWITGLLSTEMIEGLAHRFHCPIVWMLTDQEPYTGGCHYSYDCCGYTEQCGKCPQLKSTNASDRSRIVWQNKARYLRSLPITFVSSCNWTSERFRESSIFVNHRLAEIGDALDTTIFRPFDKMVARDLLHIPPNTKVIFFGAFSLGNPRKGVSYLAEALGRLSADLSKSDTNIFLLCAGHNPHDLLQSLPYPSRSLGYLKDDLTLALAYQASDVFVCPSIYEAGAMMVPEAMLCGTPVVAFDTGNAPDLIQTMVTGYRAAYKDSVDLARGIVAILHSTSLAAIGDAACKAARQRHTPELVAAQQTRLFMTLQGERSLERGC